MVSLHFLMKQLKFLYFSAGCFCGRFILHSNHKLLAWRSLKENAAINSSTRGETYHHSHIDMCVNSNKLICNWFRFSQPFIVLFTWQIGIYADTCPGNFKRSRFFRVKTNWSHILLAEINAYSSTWFDHNSSMTSWIKLINSDKNFFFFWRLTDIHLQMILPRNQS